MLGRQCNTPRDVGNAHILPRTILFFSFYSGYALGKDDNDGKCREVIKMRDFRTLSPSFMYIMYLPDIPPPWHTIHNTTPKATTAKSVCQSVLFNLNFCHIDKFLRCHHCRIYSQQRVACMKICQRSAKHVHAVICCYFRNPIMTCLKYLPALHPFPTTNLNGLVSEIRVQTF